MFSNSGLNLNFLQPCCQILSTYLNYIISYSVFRFDKETRSVYLFFLSIIVLKHCFYFWKHLLTVYFFSPVPSAQDLRVGSSDKSAFGSFMKLPYSGLSFMKLMKFLLVVIIKLINNNFVAIIIWQTYLLFICPVYLSYLKERDYNDINSLLNCIWKVRKQSLLLEVGAYVAGCNCQCAWMIWPLSLHRSTWNFILLSRTSAIRMALGIKKCPKRTILKRLAIFSFAFPGERKWFNSLPSVFFEYF